MEERIITLTMLEDFRQQLINEERSPATIEKYLRDVQHFVCFTEGKMLSRQIILAYKAKLGEYYAVSSANSMLAAMNALLRYLGWEDLCIKQFKLQRQVYLPEEKELTRAEYERLVTTAHRQGNERLCLILQTICATGIRVSELPFITVEAAKAGEAIVRCKGKTRTVLLVKELFTGAMSLYAVKKSGVVMSADWHGKLCTVLLYGTMGIHIIWGSIPIVLSKLMMFVCILVMCFSGLLYWYRNFKQIKGYVA